MQHTAYKNIAHLLPNQPGIYKYFDAQKNLIYVGKAKNLKKRVASYFTKTFAGYKTHELVKRIDSIEFTIVHTEQDALLLENALIKAYKPKYNINLKDDKTYPYIVIKKEPFARVFFTRKKINDGSEYIGPFTNVIMARDLLLFLKQIVPLRTCKLNLTQHNISKHKFKVCLEYHLGNCKGPCEGLQTQEDYNQHLQQIRDIVKGNIHSVLQVYKQQMQNYANDLAFEKAAIVKKKIEDLQQYQAKSVIVSKHLTNIDVCSITVDADTAFVNYLMVKHGTIVHTHTVQLQTSLDETPAEILSFALQQLREQFNATAAEIVVPFEIEYADSSITITVPKAGDKKLLLDLSQKNTNYFIAEIKKQKILHIAQKNTEQKNKVLHQLQQLLNLPQLPTHIECFDNSNFQGSFPVSAMVCFKNGEPSKKDYRHYNVKTVQGINDFATMQEVVNRRYTRLLAEQQPLPQLVIIDGGKGQLGAAMKSITNLQLHTTLTVVGLAKNEEELFFPGEAQSVKLPWDSDALKLVRYVRDEVHRFGITFHRNKRSKGTFVNELETIEGIGSKTAAALLKQFKSIKNIKQQSVQNLAQIVGNQKAMLIVQHYHQQ